MTDPATLHTILLIAAAAALLFAAANDLAVRIVPNGVSLIVAVAGVGLNSLDGQILSALFGAGLVFAAAWYCWRRGWIGGGDVKLLAACTLLVPPAAVPELILTTAIAGGALALLYLSLARLLVSPASATQPADLHRGLMTRIWRAERRRIRRGLSLPYACAIAAGVLLTLASPIPFG